MYPNFVFEPYLHSMQVLIVHELHLTYREVLHSPSVEPCKDKNEIFVNQILRRLT